MRCLLSKNLNIQHKKLQLILHGCETWSTTLTSEEHPHVGFEVLTAVSMKIAVFWVVAPCSLVEVYQHFNQRVATGSVQMVVGM
jgi:hypothetical protein